MRNGSLPSRAGEFLPTGVPNASPHLFYVGLHHPCDAGRFERCMVSVNTLRRRKSDFPAREWMMDSGAFSEISRHGYYRQTAHAYAAQILRWKRCGKLVAAVSQDFMCEPFILQKTGGTVEDHQRWTIIRYRQILGAVNEAAYVMPVLQGYWPDEYVSHIRQYESLLSEGQWVGVGSVCKRNAQVEEIEQVLMAIKRERPDLRLHGFGVKTTSLASSIVRACLHSADSMAWSFAARREGRNQNDAAEAERFVDKIATQPVSKRDFAFRLY